MTTIAIGARALRRDAMPPPIVPLRMARNVAPSTSALPAESSAVQMIGQDAVLDGAEQGPDDAEQCRASTNRIDDRMEQEAGCCERRDGDLSQFYPLRHEALS